MAERPTQVAEQWLLPATITAIAVLAVGVIAIAIAAALRPTGSSAPPTVVTAPAAEDFELPVEDPMEEPPTPLPTSSPQPTVAQMVRIGNTGGVGAFIRREPRTAAQGIVAYRDGTMLRIIGPDQEAEGRVWRQVEDDRGNRGWTPAEYLVPVR